MQVEFMRLDTLVSDIREHAESSVSGRHRVLTIGVATTIAPAVFSRFFEYVLSQLPEVDLHLRPMGPGEGTAEALSGKYDACILPEPPAPNFKLVCVSLFREPLRLAMATDHPLAREAVILPAQMMEEPYLDRLNCEFRTQVIEHFMNRDIVMRPRLQSEREDWVQQMVAAGLGICTIPERSVIVGGLVLRPVEGMDLAREVTLVAVSGSGSPMEMRQIVKMAKTYDWTK